MSASSRKVLLVWDNYADYHYARWRAAKAMVEKNQGILVGVELVRRNKSHQWAKPAAHSLEIITICADIPHTIWARAGFAFRFAWLLFQQTPAAVFAPSYSPLRPMIVLGVCNLMGTMTIMMNESHGESGQNRGWRAGVKRLLPKLFAGAFVAGEPHRRHFAALGFPHQRISTGYSAIDGAAFAQRSKDTDFLRRCEAKFQAPTGAIVSLGRLVAKKNIATLVRAYALVSKRLCELAPPLLIVGEGEERQALIALAHELELAVYDHAIGDDFRMRVNCVCFYPFCGNEEAAYFYTLARCFVLPSVVEEWGLVVNEAIACGTPVLISGAAGCAEDLVEPGVNGFRFSPMDVVQLSELIERIATDNALHACLRRGARGKLSQVSIEMFSTGFIQALGDSHSLVIL